MISKVLKNRLSEKDQLKKELEKKFFAQETKAGGGGFNILQKKKKC